MKAEIGTSTIIAGGFRTPLLLIDRTTSQEISEEIGNWNNTVLSHSHGCVFEYTQRFWKSQKSFVPGILVLQLVIFCRPSPFLPQAAIPQSHGVGLLSSFVESHLKWGQGLK